ncbi:PT repeat-containing protein [Nitzschia inconspicua]|uniref:PT repeat-containing protein n=1 Tax=Nitzschia inconspicua TaxID=303405 RepID=A0A9K3M7B3_9STRA|nr:PT repeat-containing protein [Nitzschia inconspicua]
MFHRFSLLCLLVALTSVESIREKSFIGDRVHDDKRFVVFNSRSLSGECLPICIPDTNPPPTDNPVAGPADNPIAAPTTPPVSSSCTCSDESSSDTYSWKCGLDLYYCASKITSICSQSMTSDVTLVPLNDDECAAMQAVKLNSKCIATSTVTHPKDLSHKVCYSSLDPLTGIKFDGSCDECQSYVALPTVASTASPTINPTAAPTANPTASPIASPTDAPTASPTVAPTAAPTTATVRSSCTCSDESSSDSYSWKCGLDLYYCASKITSICSQSMTSDVTLVPLNDDECAAMQAVKLNSKCIATSTVTHPKDLSHKVCYSSLDPLTGIKFDGSCDECQSYVALPTVSSTASPTVNPTAAPTAAPTASPTVAPTAASTAATVPSSCTCSDESSSDSYSWKCGLDLYYCASKITSICSQSMTSDVTLVPLNDDECAAMQAVKLNSKCIATSTVTHPKDLSHKVCYSSLDPLTGIKFDGSCDECESYVALPTVASTASPTVKPTAAPTASPTVAPTAASTAATVPSSCTCSDESSSDSYSWKCGLDLYYCASKITSICSQSMTSDVTLVPLNDDECAAMQAVKLNSKCIATSTVTHPKDLSHKVCYSSLDPLTGIKFDGSCDECESYVALPTVASTASPTVNPTAAPTAAPTASPTVAPTAASTAATVPSSCTCSDESSSDSYSWKCGLDLYYCASKITSICSQSMTSDVTLVPLNDDECAAMQAVKLNSKCIATSTVTHPKDLSHKVCYSSLDPLTGIKFDGTCDLCESYVALPTVASTASPTVKPTAAPTASPTVKPTAAPTASPTAKPTAAPTASPTAKPTAAPTAAPTKSPTVKPTAAPTATPTKSPTNSPTISPSSCVCSNANSPVAYTWKCGTDLYYCSSKITSICSQSMSADVVLVPLDDAQCALMNEVKLGSKCIATATITNPKALSHKVCYNSLDPLIASKFDGSCSRCTSFTPL